MSLTNPILRGFNPDPSIVRVGRDYYIATSTFEWYPGVRIHHSRDLVNWRIAAQPLNRAQLLDMRGEPDSCGVWAPCLSWHDGLFYLIYTDVKRFDGNFKDTHNYLTTCASVDGEWSDPVYLNSSGFDPSLFHAGDGRKWLLNMVWDYRPGRNPFGGIHLQEYAAGQQKLVGPVTNIFKGTALGLTEAPHLYQRNGYYYLLTAEGGTGYDHAMTMARSRSITGPYEVDPKGCILTAKDDARLPIQRAGHGDVVETPDGEVYLVHLCGRPLAGKRRCPMGRETAIQKARWTDDGWLRLAGGGNQPAATVAQPDLPLHPWPREPARIDFDAAVLPPVFQWLRTPRPQYFCSLTERPGYLRLKGRESLGSLHEQALVARRQQAFCYTAITKVEFEPEHFQQKAGLVCYYNAHKYHYLYLSRGEDGGKYLGVMSCEGDMSLKSTFALHDLDYSASLPAGVPVYLRCDVDYGLLCYCWSIDGERWYKLPVELDYSIVSDEAGKGEGSSFTGAFVGMCCQDLAGTGKAADFDFFEYRERGD